MRLLITGHRGYIGSVLAPIATARKHEVRGLDSDLYEGCDFAPSPAGFDERIKDLRDATLEDVSGIDAVVHLAALSNDPVCELDPELTMEINYEGTMRLARLAKEAGVPRFVFASSCTNYGLATDEELAEDAPLRPLTVYGESKVHAERDLALLADRDFSPVMLRNATAYGVSPRLRLDLVVNDFCAGAVARGQVTMQSDGSAWRPLIHVADIARACIAAVESSREDIHNQTFNVGLIAQNFRIKDVALAVAGTAGCPMVQREGAGADRRSYRVDFAKIAARVPQFVPHFTLQRGIDELLASFRSNPSLATDLEGDRYRRIARLRRGLAAGRLDRDLRVTASTVQSLKK